MAFKPDIFVQAAGGGEREDFASEVFNAARIYASGFIVLINQSFEVAQRAIGFRAGQGWREVIYDHRLRTPLGLGAFAGVIDDEGVDMRHRPQNCLGQAAVTQGQGLARQPFQIAMLAHMYSCLCLLVMANPEIEGQIVMRRDKIGRMIGFHRINIIPARRLQAQSDLAEAQN